MPRTSRRIVLAAAAIALAAGPGLAAAPRVGVPAEAVGGDMSLGSAKARVQVLEYASAACPHCAHWNETYFADFKAKYVDTGRVRYTVKEFLTAPAQVAAAGFLLARCGGRAKYFTILDQVFRSQSRWQSGNIAPIFIEVGVANGLSEEQINACFTDEAAIAALNARVEAAMTKDHVNSTPTFVVNGKVLDDVTLEALDAAIVAAEAAKAPKPPGRKPAARKR